MRRARWPTVDGLAELSAKDWSLVEAYRFGSATADYLICRRCGVYVAAICETSAGTRAVVNVNCLTDRAAFTAEPVVSEYDGEATDVRLARRAVELDAGGRAALKLLSSKWDAAERGPSPPSPASGRGKSTAAAQ